MILLLRYYTVALTLLLVHEHDKQHYAGIRWSDPSIQSHPPARSEIRRIGSPFLIDHRRCVMCVSASQMQTKEEA